MAIASSLRDARLACNGSVHIFISYETKVKAVTLTETPTPSREFELGEFVPYLTSALADRLSAGLAGVYAARFGITNAEWRVLAHLAANARVSVREIYARVSMDKVKVSRAAARLEQAGLILKQINKADQRLVELQLSARGRALFARIAPLALAYEDEALSSLTENERRAFRDILRKLSGARGAGASAVAEVT
jgi:DNA-binding MarR family transcriptional regulator